MTILLACISMACRDALGTGLMVAEARNRAVLAGMFDALGDLAQIAVMAIGAGTVILHGVTLRSCVVLAAMMATSFFGTVLDTKLANRWMPAKT